MPTPVFLSAGSVCVNGIHSPWALSEQHWERGRAQRVNRVLSPARSKHDTRRGSGEGRDLFKLSST